jgi:hypothetical protein
MSSSTPRKSKVPAEASDSDIEWRYFCAPFGMVLLVSLFLCAFFSVPRHADDGVVESIAAVIVALMIALNVSPAFRARREDDAAARQRIASGSAGMTAVGGIGLLGCFLAASLHTYSRGFVWPAAASVVVYLVALAITPILDLDDD